MLNLLTKCLCLKPENDTSVSVPYLIEQKSMPSSTVERTDFKKYQTDIDDNMAVDSPTITTKSSTHLFPKSSDNYFRRGKSLSSQEKWDVALRNYAKFIENRRVEHKEEDSEVAEAYHQMGKIYELRYDFDDALKSFKRSFEIRAKLYGRNHLESIEAGILVGDMYSKMLQDFDAEDYYQIALKFYESEPKPYQEVAELYLKIGKIHQERGDLDIALEYIQKALKNKLAFVDKEQLEVAKYYDALGLVHCRMNEYEKAYTSINAGLQIRLKKLEPKDPFVAASYNNLSMILCGLGKFDEALKAARNALDIYVSNYGDSHLIITNTYDSIALVYKNQDKFDEAIDYCLKSQAIRSKSYSGDVPPSDLAKTYHILGDTYFKTGRNQEALKFFRTALEIRMNHSPSHPDIIDYYRTIAQIYERSGILDKAIDYLLKTTIKYREKYGESSIKLAEFYYQLGNMYLRTREYDHAHTYFEKSYEIYLNLDGEKYKCELAKCLRDISITIAFKKNFEDALVYINKAIMIFKTVPDNLELACCFSNKGSFYYSMNQLDEAEKCFKEGLVLYEKAKSKPNRDFVMMLNNLGNIHYSRKDYKIAKTFYEKAITVKNELYGEEHPSLWTSLNNLALCFYHEKDNILSQEHYSKSFKIAIRSFGEEFEGLKFLFYNMGDFYLRTYDYQKALVSYKKGIEICLNSMEDDSNHIIYLLQSKIAECYSRQEKISKSIDSYRKSIQMLKTLNEKDEYWTELQEIYEKYLTVLKKSPKIEDLTKYNEEFKHIKEKVQQIKEKRVPIKDKTFHQEVIEIQEYYYSINETEHSVSNSIESSDKSQKFSDF